MKESFLSKGRRQGTGTGEKNGALFVCGTDTSVGKTFFCAHLLAYLCAQEVDAGYQKWISTGEQGRPVDLEYCFQVAGKKTDPALLDLQVPYRFQYPASPHLAAAREGRVVDPARIVESFHSLKKRYRFLIVEGVGGAMVPLTGDLLLVDLVASLAIPTLVVARSGLGTLNHTLLTLEALRARSIPIVGVVFSDGPAEVDDALAADNLQTVSTLGRVEVFGRLPMVGEDGGQKAFKGIGEALVNTTGLLRCFD